MSDSFEFTLHSPLTKEDWDKISDVEHEKTTSVTFQTSQGRQVRYIKSDVLDKIRDEIKQLPITDTAVRLVDEIIDKYRTESEEQVNE